MRLPQARETAKALGARRAEAEAELRGLEADLAGKERAANQVIALHYSILLYMQLCTRQISGS